MLSSSLSNLWGEGSSDSVSGLLQLNRDNKPNQQFILLSCPFPKPPQSTLTGVLSYDALLGFIFFYPQNGRPAFHLF